MSDDIQVYVKHIRAAQLCTGGARDWFKARGWDWSDFLARGRPIRDFRETGDPLAARVVAAAVKDADDGR